MSDPFGWSESSGPVALAAAVIVCATTLVVLGIGFCMGLLWAMWMW